jgi:hypothetical protein
MLSYLHMSSLSDQQTGKALCKRKNQRRSHTDGFVVQQIAAVEIRRKRGRSERPHATGGWEDGDDDEPIYSHDESERALRSTSYYQAYILEYGPFFNLH